MFLRDLFIEFYDKINTKTCQMKISMLTMSFFLLIFANTFSQECNSFQDCYDKGNNSKGEKVISYHKKGAKYAKKEPANLGKANLAIAKIYYNQIRGKDNKKAIKNASKYFEQALDADSSNFFAWEWIVAFHQLKTKEFNLAIEWSNKMIAKFPNYSRAYYNRGHVYRYYNNLPKAYADFEKASSLLVSEKDDSNLSESNLADVLLWSAFMNNKKNNRKFYAKEDIATLKKYVDKFPNSPKLWGELALAYFDNGSINEAITAGNRAWVLDGERDFNDYNGVSVGGNFIKGYQDFQNKNYKAAAFRFSAAEADNNDRHVLPTFYKALGNFFYYVEMLPKKWKDIEAQTKKLFQKTIDATDGTKYQGLADNARAQLEAINNPNSTAGRTDNWPREFEQFKINFNALPSSYTLNYNTLQGRGITSLPATKEFFPYAQEVNAIGLLCEGTNSYAFLVMLRTRKSNQDRSSFFVLKTDKNGKQLALKKIAGTQKDMGRVTITGSFSFTRSESGYSINGVDTYANGHKNTTTDSGSCN